MTVQDLLEFIEVQCKLYPELPTYTTTIKYMPFTFSDDATCTVSINHAEGRLIFRPIEAA